MLAFVSQTFANIVDIANVCVVNICRHCEHLTYVHTLCVIVSNPSLHSMLLSMLSLCSVSIAQTHSFSEGQQTSLDLIVRLHVAKGVHAQVDK